MQEQHDTGNACSSSSSSRSSSTGGSGNNQERTDSLGLTAADLDGLLARGDEERAAFAALSQRLPAPGARLACTAECAALLEAVRTAAAPPPQEDLGMYGRGLRSMHSTQAHVQARLVGSGKLAPVGPPGDQPGRAPPLPTLVTRSRCK